MTTPAISPSDLTSAVPVETLALHGRLRLLRGHRNREAQQMRKTVEVMHSMLMRTLQSLTGQGLTQPLDHPEFRRLHDEMQASEDLISRIDAESAEVNQLLEQAA